MFAKLALDCRMYSTPSPMASMVKVCGSLAGEIVFGGRFGFPSAGAGLAFASKVPKVESHCGRRSGDGKMK
jgi:hypothetical protein